MALQQMLKLPLNPSFDDRKTDEQLVENELDYIKNLTPFTRLPASLVNQMSDRQMLVDSTGKKFQIKYDKGTTTLAFLYKGGVCVAVDSKATGGDFVASRQVKKVIPIHNHMIGTMAGCAADCSYWYRVLSMRCRLHELRNRESMSVAAASKWLSNTLYGYKNMGLSMGVMVAGWDKKGADLLFVSDDGSRYKGNLFSVGSGSSFAYGAFEPDYKYDMEDEEAFDLARRAIYHATMRDIMSGGFVRVYAINKDGWRMISSDDCKDLHFMYQEQKMQN